MSEVDVVRAIYEAMAAYDLERLRELFDQRCIITQDEALPWGGHHIGHDGLAEFAMALGTMIESKVTVDAIFEADGEVIEVGRTRGTVRETGVPFDLPEVHRWTIRDGRAVSAHFAIDTPGMMRALTAPAP